MQVSLEAKRNGVAFRQPTFKNPLPKMFKALGKVLFGIFVAIIAAGESAGRARAARELANLGMYEEAKRLMLRKDEDDNDA